MAAEPKTLAIKVSPEIDYTAARTYARTMRDHYTALLADLDDLDGHDCATECGHDTEGKKLWHAAIYIPENRADVMIRLIQHELGCPVYRAWPVERETHEAKFTDLESHFAVKDERDRIRRLLLDEAAQYPVDAEWGCHAASALREVADKIGQPA